MLRLEYGFFDELKKIAESATSISESRYSLIKEAVNPFPAGYIAAKYKSPISRIKKRVSQVAGSLSKFEPDVPKNVDEGVEPLLDTALRSKEFASLPRHMRGNYIHELSQVLKRSAPEIAKRYEKAAIKNKVSVPYNQREPFIRRASEPGIHKAEPEPKSFEEAIRQTAGGLFGDATRHAFTEAVNKGLHDTFDNLGVHANAITPLATHGFGSAGKIKYKNRGREWDPEGPDRSASYDALIDNPLQHLPLPTGNFNRELLRGILRRASGDLSRLEDPPPKILEIN